VLVCSIELPICKGLDGLLTLELVEGMVVDCTLVRAVGDKLAVTLDSRRHPFGGALRAQVAAKVTFIEEDLDCICFMTVSLEELDLDCLAFEVSLLEQVSQKDLLTAKLNL